MAKQRFPVFLPIGAEDFTGSISWTPYNSWWIVIVLATYFTVIFVPFDIAFSKDRGGAPFRAAMSTPTDPLTHMPAPKHQQ